MGKVVGFSVLYIGFIAFGVFQMWAAWLGITSQIGPSWAVGAIILAIIFRTSLPILVGAFLGALNVWGWHWALAALFAAPGLLLVLPGFFLFFGASFKRQRNIATE